MKIVDAQVHIWSSGTPSGHHRQTSVFTAEELLREMDAAGVHAAVIHPPSWDANANTMAIEAVRRHPSRFAILGQFPLDKPESRGLLEHWKDQPGMLGLRTALVLPHQQSWHEDGTLDWLWPAAERLGIPFATMAWRFLPAFARIAERHPRLKLIIDHLGVVRAAQDDAAFETVPELVAIARKYPNVAMKATGAPSYSSGVYPFRNIHDHLHRLYDAFG
ncbi:MAG TPA: amidohydrolase family protein, partial [Acetobacteraceae bacterium]|nr:amidohydrolase family protein [Acetobacteraceae bacterium]